MSGTSELKSMTCPKCRNKNPTEAAFCGFCGADLRARIAPEKATMFGYVSDLKLAPAGAGGLQPRSDAASAAHAAADPALSRRTASASSAATSTDEVPTTAYAAGEGYVSGRYWLQSRSTVAVGELYDAKDTEGGQDVDVLLVDAAMFPSPLDMERARRELRQLQKVQNKHLVKVLDHGKHDDGRLYVVTERVRAESLSDRVAARGRLALEEAQQLLRGIGAGLAAAQTVGIVHRDVAPQGIVIAADGTVKVRVLGVAPLVRDHIFGTAEFLSPEQAAGRPVDQRSNIYSLGCLLFYMLAGRPPFTGDTNKLIEQHKNDEAPPLGALGIQLATMDRVQALLTKAMAKNSSRRHLTLRQFLREVEGLDGSPTASYPGVGGRASTDDPTSSPTPAAGTPATSNAATGTPATGTPVRANVPTGTTAKGRERPAGDLPSAPVVRVSLAESPSRQVVIPSASDAGRVDDRAATMLGDLAGNGRTAQPILLTQPSTPHSRSQPVDTGSSASPARPSKPQAKLILPNQPEEELQELRLSIPFDAALQPEPVPLAVSGQQDVYMATNASGSKGPSGQPATARTPLASQPTHPPVSAAGANTVVGEMSGGERVEMRQTNEHRAVEAATASAATPQSGSGTPQSGSGGAAKGFRETMWFFKGEVESAMAQKGEASAPVTEVENPAELAEKYADDGSITDEAASRLSLRTGRTQMMQAVKVPSGQVPGDKMRAEEFIGEINRGRTIGIALVGLIVAAVVGLVVWLAFA